MSLKVHKILCHISTAKVCVLLIFLEKHIKTCSNMFCYLNLGLSLLFFLICQLGFNDNLKIFHFLSANLKEHPTGYLPIQYFSKAITAATFLNLCCNLTLVILCHRNQILQYKVTKIIKGILHNNLLFRYFVIGDTFHQESNMLSLY